MSAADSVSPSSSFSSLSTSLSAANAASSSSSSSIRWSLLPRDVLLIVYSFLPEPSVRLVCRCSCVCRMWRAAAYDKLLWLRLVKREGWLLPRELLAPPPQLQLSPPPHHHSSFLAARAIKSFYRTRTLSLRHYRRSAWQRVRWNAHSAGIVALAVPPAESVYSWTEGRTIHTDRGSIISAGSAPSYGIKVWQPQSKAASSSSSFSSSFSSVLSSNVQIGSDELDYSSPPLCTREEHIYANPLVSHAAAAAAVENRGTQPLDPVDTNLKAHWSCVDICTSAAANACQSEGADSDDSYIVNDPFIGDSLTDLPASSATLTHRAFSRSRAPLAAASSSAAASASSSSSAQLHALPPLSSNFLLFASMQRALLHAYDMETKRLRRFEPGHTSAVCCVKAARVFRPKGQLMWTPSLGSNAQRWRCLRPTNNIAAVEALFAPVPPLSVPANVSPISHAHAAVKVDPALLGLSPSSRLCVSGAYDATVRVYHIDSGRLVATLKGDCQQTVWCVDSVVVTQPACTSYTLPSDSAADGYTVAPKRCNDHITTAAVCPYTRTLRLVASGSDDDCVRLWRLDPLCAEEAAAEMWAAEYAEKAATSQQQRVQRAESTREIDQLSPAASMADEQPHSSSLLAADSSAMEDSEATAAAVPSDSPSSATYVSGGQLLCTLRGHTGCPMRVCFDPFEPLRYVWSCGYDKTIKRWRIDGIEEGATAADDPAPSPRSERSMSSASASGDAAATAVETETYDLETERALALGAYMPSSSAASSSPAADSASDAAASPLVSGAVQGRCVRTFTGHTAVVFCLEVLQHVLISSGRDGTVRIYDKDAGVCVRILDSAVDSSALRSQIAGLNVSSDTIRAGQSAPLASKVAQKLDIKVAVVTNSGDIIIAASDGSIARFQFDDDSRRSNGHVTKRQLHAAATPQPSMIGRADNSNAALVGSAVSDAEKCAIM